ncbi:NACHT domain-containing protein [Catenulispora yoronensis]
MPGRAGVLVEKGWGVVSRQVAVAQTVATSSEASRSLSGLFVGIATGVLLVLVVSSLIIRWASPLIASSLLLRGSLMELAADLLALARSRTLRRIRRYQRSVREYAREHALGFGTEPINVQDVYVPLARQVADKREDLYEAVREERRSVVTGEAGAGKSMLLKHSLLEWADSRTDRRSKVPVLIELRRLNAVPADAVDLAEQIRMFLEAHRFAGAADFVPAALADGRISVLFDGLDEVTADRFADVVRHLTAFAERYPDCQVVVTCRSSLYRDDLGFPTVVRVAELDDATIRRLLYRLSDLDSASQERLYRTLGTNPTLKRLARSPLLLSMMAWMTSMGIMLPTSRAEFYDTAIENLVRRDDTLNRGRSNFAANKKLVVLRGIALILQERAGTDEDRLNISHAQALEHIRTIAASIDLDQSDAEPLLREIVDRSELLASSGGVAPSYFFRHLTFQEYLAAVELRDDRDGLLERYERDPNAWRETVKLWCGRADRDATPLIRHLLDSDSADAHTMALECASVTTRVAESIVVEAVDRLEKRLTDERDVLDRAKAVQTFGNAAAGSGPRSALIRERLFELARDPRHEWPAMQALGATGHESAAKFLAAKSASGDARARTVLTWMGDLAVPSLRAFAREGGAAAVDDLAMIGTPSAIEALVEALVEVLAGSDEAAVRAAWRLAERLDDPVASETMARCSFSGLPSASTLWVWERFSGGSEVLAAVVGRIYRLVNASDPTEIPADAEQLDFRFVLASVVVGRQYPSLADAPESVAKAADAVLKETRAGARAVTANLVASARIEAALSVPEGRTSLTPAGQKLEEELLGYYRLEPVHAKMVETLDWRDRLRVLALMGSHHTRGEWAAVTTSTLKKPRGGPYAWIVLGVMALYMSALGFWREAHVAKEHGGWVERGIAGLATSAPGVLVMAVLVVGTSLEDSWIAVVLAILAVLGVALAVPVFLKDGLYLTAGWIGWSATWIGFAAVIAPATCVLLHASHRGKRYNNPLRKAIEEAKAMSSSTSIIAMSTRD